MTVNVSRCVCSVLKRRCSGLYRDGVYCHVVRRCYIDYNVEHSLFEGNRFEASKCRCAKIVGWIWIELSVDGGPHSLIKASIFPTDIKPVITFNYSSHLNSKIYTTYIHAKVRIYVWEHDLSFDDRRCYSKLTRRTRYISSFRPHYGLGVDSASVKNQYHGYQLEVKVAGV